MFKKKNLIKDKKILKKSFKYSTFNINKIQKEITHITSKDRGIKKLKSFSGGLKIKLNFKQKIYTKRLNLKTRKYKYFRIKKTGKLNEINKKFYFRNKFKNNKVIFKNELFQSFKKIKKLKKKKVNVRSVIVQDINTMTQSFFDKKDITLQQKYQSIVKILYKNFKDRVQEDINKLKNITIGVDLEYQVEKIIQNGKKKKKKKKKM